MFEHEHPGQFETRRQASANPQLEPKPIDNHGPQAGCCTVWRSLDIGTIIDLLSTVCFPVVYLYLIRQSFPQIPQQGSYFIIAFPIVFTLALLLAQFAMLSSNLYNLPCLRNFVPNLELHTATKCKCSRSLCVF